MRRTGLLVGGWLVATVLALVCGLLGVRAIADTVTSSRPASLSPASIRTALQETRAASSSSEAESESSAPADASGIATASNESEHAATTTSVPVPPASSSSDDRGSGGSEPPSIAPLDRTYQLVGGSVGVRFENNAAQLLWAQPNAGYSVDIGGDSSAVDVRFREINGDHESRLKAYWNDGPQQEIEEKND